MFDGQSLQEYLISDQEHCRQVLWKKSFSIKNISEVHDYESRAEPERNCS
jgi:hypothetical protein